MDIGDGRREALSPARQEVTARQQQIARRAYEVWLQRGCPSGSELRDWSDAEAEVAPALVSVAAANAAADAVDPVRVLIVDDAAAVRRLLRALLGGADGVEVVGEAANGAEAVELARRLRPDVVLMDVVMPVMDGVAATAAIVDALPGVRVLGLSISGDDATAAAMAAAGAAVHLAKGGAADDLIAAVRVKELEADLTRQSAERRAAEEALRTSDAWNRAVLETALDAILVMDHKGRLVDLNPAAEAMFGYARSDSVGRPLAELIIPAALRDAHRRGLADCVRIGGPSPGTRREMPALRADGTEFPAELSIARVAGSDPPRFTGFVRDLSGQKAAELRLRQLADVVEAAEDAIIGARLDGTVTSWNGGAERTYGYSAGEMLGRSLTTLHPPGPNDRSGLPAELSEILERVGRGESVRRREAVRRRKDGRLIEVSLTVSPVRDYAGAVVGTSAVARDVTDRKTAERQRAAEHAVVRVLAESGSLAEARAGILEAICGHLGWDFGAVWETDPDLGVLRCTCTRQAPAAGTPEFDRLSRELSLAAGMGLPGRVWASGEPAWVSYPSDDPNYLRRDVAVREGLRSALAFPIADRERFFGVVEFLSRDVREPDPGLLEVLAHIGAQVAQFVERRRAEEALHGRRRELELAREIQQAVLPKGPPKLPGFAIAAVSHPAQETGGDLFDFIPLPDGGLGIAVGDASGHGLGPALVIAATRAYLRAFASHESDPGRLLARTNRCLVDDLGDHFVTLFLARLDPAGRSLTYANAGHWPGHVLGLDGKCRAELRSTSFPLGLVAGADFPTSDAVRLEPGDRLLLLTDGVTEATSPSGEPFGVVRALDVVRESPPGDPKAVLAALTARLDEFAHGRFLDDRTAVLLEACVASAVPDGEPLRGP